MSAGARANRKKALAAATLHVRAARELAFFDDGALDVFECVWLALRWRDVARVVGRSQSTPNDLEKTMSSNDSACHSCPDIG